MANLYLTEQNSILRKTGDRLIVQKNEETLLDYSGHECHSSLSAARQSGAVRKGGSLDINLISTC